MPQPFLETGEHGLVVTGLDIDDPIRRQPGLRDRRRKQILADDTPQDLPLGARHDAGGEQSRGGPVDSAVTPTSHLMQRPHGEPAAGQPTIDLSHAERQCSGRATASGLKAADFFRAGFR